MKRALLFAALLPWSVVLADPPDAAVNPTTGNIEVVDVLATGGAVHIRHTLNQGQQALQVTELSTGTVTDVAHKVVVSSAGEVWVTWWRDGSTRQIFVRKRSQGTWDAERLVSDAGQSSKKPQILHDGTNPWIGYEYVSGNGTGIAVSKVIDGPDPINPVTIATTSFAGNVDGHVHASSGHLWVTWVDSASQVGWSEYDHQAAAWGTPNGEPYDEDSVSEARARIESHVLSN